MISETENQIADHGHCWLEIEITTGVMIKIDAEDLERVRKFKWWREVRPCGSERIFTHKGKQSTGKILLARFIMENSPADFICFRDSQERRDFRKSNLVACSRKERQRKLGKKKTPTSSIYKGVYFAKQQKSWRARIEVSGKNISLGAFGTEEEAALAYNEAAQRYFGDFAWLNNVTGRPRRRCA